MSDMPRWMMQDPSKHVDYIRRKRRELEERQKKLDPRQELEKLFQDKKGRNEQK